MTASLSASAESPPQSGSNRSWSWIPPGYVRADESTRTNLPGVFAVGDVRTKALRQVVTAVADGAVAAHYAETYLLEKG